MLRFRAFNIRTIPTAPTSPTLRQSCISKPKLSTTNNTTSHLTFNITRSFSTQAGATAKVPVDLIKELRSRTLAGYTDCKNALQAENMDMDKAIQWLRKKGALKAAAKAGRVAAEGLVAFAINDSKN